MSKVKNTNYSQKFDSLAENVLFNKLDQKQQKFIKDIAFQYRFTFQEFRQIVEVSRDLQMWQENDIKTWWQKTSPVNNLTGKQLKKYMFTELDKYLFTLRSKPTIYKNSRLPKPKQRETKKITIKKSDKEIYGMCPVASPKTICCNLQTIDAVENCTFGCSYCTIQTFYTTSAQFDAELEEKLSAIELDPNRFYHFGSGQSSDSLAWGNRNKNLNSLCKFAFENPNILLEFKTKSDNINYFIENKIPPNIVCSFSLNSETIIENEEHFTASLEQRIRAAKKLAAHGIKVAFHFHPLVYYVGWDKDYPAIAKRLIKKFKIDDVLFLSFGSITLIKPVIQKIRELGNPTKTLQMELLPDPLGKLTYPDSVKIKMFKKMYSIFQPWQKDVFIYLCMEKSDIWKKSLGHVYETNEKFEQDFGNKTMCKIISL